MTHNRAGDKGEKKSWEKMGLREQLIGAWRLVSYIESPVDGSPKRVPMGRESPRHHYVHPGWIHVSPIDDARKKELCVR
jgi:hypothetical protein